MFRHNLVTFGTWELHSWTRLFNYKQTLSILSIRERGIVSSLFVWLGQLGPNFDSSATEGLCRAMQDTQAWLPG